MLSYSEALALVREAAGRLPAESITLEKALNRVAAADLFSPVDVPSFANSAMDGFALHSEQTAAATKSQPVRLAVAGTLTAGDSATSFSVEEGQAVEIMTGSPVPAGCDAVIPLECVDIVRDASSAPEYILVDEVVAAERNLRSAGEDFRAGDQLLAAGESISTNQMMGLAATGVSRIAVTEQPTLGMITTGKELTSGNLGNTSDGMINDANGPYLAAVADTLRLPCAGLLSCGDSPAQLHEQLNQLCERAQVILTTGGVSAGRMDFVPNTLKEMGAEIVFHKISIRPGKPLLFARMPRGQLIFGLPGNPIAVAVGIRFFVLPALLRMQGLKDEVYIKAKLSSPMRKKPGMAFFAKALAERAANGTLSVAVLPGQESFKISPLMQANCWVIANDDAEEIAAGSEVAIAPMFPGDAL